MTGEHHTWVVQIIAGELQSCLRSLRRGDLFSAGVLVAHANAHVSSLDGEVKERARALVEFVSRRGFREELAARDARP